MTLSYKAVQIGPETKVHKILDPKRGRKEIVMSHREKVQDKIRDSVGGREERLKLWEEICSTYEQGGVEQVGSRLTEKMESLEKRFKEVIEKLQQML